LNLQVEFIDYNLDLVAFDGRFQSGKEADLTIVPALAVLEHWMTGYKIKARKVFVLHHADCNDGYGASVAAQLGMLQTYGRTLPGCFPVELVFQSQQYGDGFAYEDYRDCAVVFVDYCPQTDELKELLQYAHVIILDHHKTAYEYVRPVLTAQRSTFEPSRLYVHLSKVNSGASLTYRHFSKFKLPLPSLFQYLQDRDLWQFKYPDTNEVHYALMGLPKRFHEWALYLHDDPRAVGAGYATPISSFPALIDHGRVVQGFMNEQAKDLASWAVSARFHDYDILVAQTISHLKSEVAHILSKGRAFGMAYYDQGDSRYYSLRADDAGIDVSKIAREYGGGGHAKAAAFQMRMDMSRDIFGPVVIPASAHRKPIMVKSRARLEMTEEYTLDSPPVEGVY
jgi:oligoribonuclease NrnB/cAMP/cGMP phosphodiesterase (DHH superfamily)